MHIEELDYIWMTSKGLEEDDFAKRSLGVSFVAKRIEDLLDG